MPQPDSTIRHENPLVEAKNIDFSFGSRQVYDNLSLTIPRGKVTAVMGPSGCGKSTLLSLIGGRLRPASGEILFDDQPVPKANRALFEMRKHLGMLFQRSALLTDLTVFDNVAFPLREQTDLPEELIRTVVLLKLEMVGLRGARDLHPAELSGGMARRVALARAVALDPELVMYDEPFTGLDPISMGVIVKLIREMNDALGLTSVIVTHDVAEGCSIADYVYLLGNGKVLGAGTPQQVMASEQPEILQFIAGLPDGPVPYHYPAPDYLQDLMNQNNEGANL